MHGNPYSQCIRWTLPQVNKGETMTGKSYETHCIASKLEEIENNVVDFVNGFIGTKRPQYRVGDDITTEHVDGPVSPEMLTQDLPEFAKCLTGRANIPYTTRDPVKLCWQFTPQAHPFTSEREPGAKYNDQHKAWNRKGKEDGIYHHFCDAAALPGLLKFGVRKASTLQNLETHGSVEGDAIFAVPEIQQDNSTLLEFASRSRFVLPPRGVYQAGDVVNDELMTYAKAQAKRMTDSGAATAIFVITFTSACPPLMNKSTAGKQETEVAFRPQHLVFRELQAWCGIEMTTMAPRIGTYLITHTKQDDPFWHSAYPLSVPMNLPSDTYQLRVLVPLHERQRVCAKRGEAPGKTPLHKAYPLKYGNC
jgi:hypothetical protein